MVFRQAYIIAVEKTVANATPKVDRQATTHKAYDCSAISSHHPAIQSSATGKNATAITASRANHDVLKRLNARQAFLGFAKCKVDENKPKIINIKPITHRVANSVASG